MSRAVAEVPRARRAQGIAWLVLEADRASGGWFLFLHRSLGEACTFDGWHSTRAEALREAEIAWGVRADDWREAPTDL